MPGVDRNPGDEPLPRGVARDRRSGADRRDLQSAEEASGFERRRGPGRRLSDFVKAAEEGEMTPEQFLFLVAINEFKKANGVAYPSWTDVLEVVRLLGYRKTTASEIVFRNAEDWREKPDTPSGVRPQRWQDRFTPGELGDRDAA